MIDKYRTLISYALKILSITGHGNIYLDKYPPPSDEWTTKYENAIEVNKKVPDVLPNIFAFVSLDKDITPPLTYVAPLQFNLNEIIFPVHTEGEATTPESKWDKEEFIREFDQVEASLKEIGDDHLFEGFYHLFRRWASALPGSCGGAGISLFEQWKAVAALVFASGDLWEKGPAENFSLVGGDIPGIQDFVYTITSRGATRGLRGRSYFVQLLGDAVVRRLLSEFNLTSANIIVEAGGNFIMLAPAGVEERLTILAAEFEKSLLKSFEGDLTVCLASEPISRAQLFTNEFSDLVMRSLKEKIAAQKQCRFSQVAKNEWSALFEPQGKPGNKHCVICQRMLGEKEGIQNEEAGSFEEPTFRCEACDGFQQLARNLADATCLVLTDKVPTPVWHWQQSLFTLCGQYYVFSRRKQKPSSYEWVYLINEPDFAGAAHGYRLIANTTPKVTEEDIQNHPDDIEAGTRPGDIRTFSLLATLSKGFKKVGVLRMDVDNLGQIMAFGLKERTLLTTSSLSSALDRFFTGWLNKICADINNRNERLYTIYAGGDDLFIVGSWDLIPDLADRIQADFDRYTGNNPALHISGGISLEDRKFPLYQAADRAGEAEQKAKDHERIKIEQTKGGNQKKENNEKKNAISFLGVACKWDQWQKVKEYRQTINNLIITHKVPEALIQRIQDIYGQYQQQVLDTKKKAKKSSTHGKKPVATEKVVYGPWIWRASYSLTRMSKRSDNPEVDGLIKQLLKACQNPETLELVALASRWVELEMRKEKSNA